MGEGREAGEKRLRRVDLLDIPSLDVGGVTVC